MFCTVSPCMSVTSFFIFLSWTLRECYCTSMFVSRICPCHIPKNLPFWWALFVLRCHTATNRASKLICMRNWSSPSCLLWLRMLSTMCSSNWIAGNSNGLPWISRDMVSRCFKKGSGRDRLTAGWILKWSDRSRFTAFSPFNLVIPNWRTIFVVTLPDYYNWEYAFLDSDLSIHIFNLMAYCKDLNLLKILDSLRPLEML